MCRRSHLFPYSRFASIKIGKSGSASFHAAKKSTRALLIAGARQGGAFGWLTGSWRELLVLHAILNREDEQPGLDRTINPSETRATLAPKGRQPQ